MSKFVQFILLATIFVSFASACPGLFGMGGGGGCGCGAPPPPPPPSCGCGGRKKRSIDDEERALAPVTPLCNAPELRSIMEENIKSDPVESSKSLQVALESEIGQRFLVICAKTPFEFQIHKNTQFCSIKANEHYCQAFEQF